MEDLFKKFLYTGIGFVSLTAEKLQEAVDELVGKGKISKDEGKKIVDDFLNSTEAKKDEFESRLKETVESVLDKVTYPSRAEFDALNKKVTDLERKLNAQNKASAPKSAATKKTATKTASSTTKTATKTASKTPSKDSSKPASK